VLTETGIHTKLCILRVNRDLESDVANL